MNSNQSPLVEEETGEDDDTANGSKLSNVFCKQHKWTATSTGDQTTVNLVVTEMVFPKIKFVDRDTQLMFSHEKNSICQYVIRRCNLHSDISLPNWWKHVHKFAFAMKDIVEGRKNEEAYSAFFEHLLPCATKKTLWDRRIAKAVSNSNSKKYQSLCTISDEAFALLLLENSCSQWLDLLFNKKGPVMQQRGVKQRGFQSDVSTLYTRGGKNMIIRY
jgi:hypothetical protein